MMRIRMPVCRPTSPMKSPPVSGSRVALVADATISSTLLESARRLNFASVCSAADIADWVSFLPSSPPAPSRTMSFSLSITSKDRSGRTFTTIMWMEFVPVSMAAMRMQRWAAQPGPALACYTVDIYLLTRQQKKGPAGRHPTMNTRAPRITTALLQRLSRALNRHLPAAVAGDDTAVHQARVTTRRLREAVPVLATGLAGSKSGKAQKKIRRLTRALGCVRELDVTIQLLDELARSPNVSRDAVEDVRARVVKERDDKRKTMIERLDGVNTEKLDRRLASGGAALDQAASEPWRKALAERLMRRSRRLTVAMNEAGQMYAPERLHAVRIAAKKLRYGLELAANSGVKQAAPHVRTIKRAQEMLGKLHDLQVLQVHCAAVQAEPRTGRPQSRAALENLARHIEDQCRHLHGRYIASASVLRDAALAVRKVVVPQLAHPSRRARSIKMTLSRPADARAAAGDR